VIAFHRRQILVSTAATAVLSLFDSPVFAEGNNSSGTFAYRGFKLDISGAPNFATIEASLKHQIDIVASCGASPKVLGFFRSQEIIVKPGRGDGGGHFSANSNGVTVDAVSDAPEKPVVLHELLHAYHWRVLPEGFGNSDILTFYNRAKEGGFYPPGAYVLKNVQEFFAVTASLYLWGNVDRPPHDRKTLHDSQPVYYKWLGNQFGVPKAA
jgi:hypothetical protein